MVHPWERNQLRSLADLVLRSLPRRWALAACLLRYWSVARSQMDDFVMVSMISPPVLGLVVEDPGGDLFGASSDHGLGDVPECLLVAVLPVALVADRSLGVPGLEVGG